MTTRVPRVPKPARAGALTKASVRRAIGAFAAGGVVSLLLLVVMDSCAPGPLGGIGPVALYQRRQPWFPGSPFGRRVTKKRGISDGCLWVTYPTDAPGISDDAVLVAGCGCRFIPSQSMLTSGMMLRVWTNPPRAEPVLRVSAGGREIEIENSGAAPAPATGTTNRPLLTLPWTADVGTARVAVTAWPGTASVSVESVPGSPDDESAVRFLICDAAGNTSRMAQPPQGSSYVLPFGSVLCPHTDWWEIEVTPREGEPVTARFAPPR